MHVSSEDDARSPRRRRTLVIVVLVVAVLVVAGGIVLWRDRGRDDAHAAVSSGGRALERLDTNDGRTYVGTIGEVSDPTRLRRVLRTEFRADEPRARPRGSATRARRCVSALRAASGGPAGRGVYLADATLSGAPVVVVGITDHSRVVAFVVDPATCDVRMAQSL